MEGGINLPFLFFHWWYSLAYRRILKYIRAFFIFVTDLFSVKISLKTLFAPWKRDIISYEGLTLQQKFQVWTLNLAARFVGFIIKTVTLAIYAAFIIFLSFFSLFLIIFWGFYPLVIAGLIYSGFLVMAIK